MGAGWVDGRVGGWIGDGWEVVDGRVMDGWVDGRVGGWIGDG